MVRALEQRQQQQQRSPQQQSRHHRQHVLKQHRNHNQHRHLRRSSIPLSLLGFDREQRACLRKLQRARWPRGAVVVHILLEAQSACRHRRMVVQDFRLRVDQAASIHSHQQRCKDSTVAGWLRVIRSRHRHPQEEAVLRR
jgi:hypothetical protein